MKILQRLKSVVTISAILSFGLLTTNSLAGVIVNEVLVNEPGGSVALEWIELWNDSSVAVTMDGYTLLVNGNIVTLPGGLTLVSDEYGVISRDVTAFESFWGDSSGVWGDNLLLENYPLYNAAFGLANRAGIITLSAFASDSSELNWPSSGSDGISWERRIADDPTAVTSLDSSGSTPGRRNSQTPLQSDWSLGEVSVAPESAGQAKISVTVFNAGLDDLPATYCLFELNNDSLAALVISPLGKTDSTLLEAVLFLPGYYSAVVITIAGTDDNPGNNTASVTAPGELFPPVVLTEMLPDPEDPLASEWIEIRNVSGETIDLRDWLIGDSLNVSPIGVGVSLSPGGYLILAQDAASVSQFYPLLSESPVEVAPWRALNNGGDVVRLMDGFGFLADRFSYEQGWGGNHTWSRSQTAGEYDLWGRSSTVGGTPGDSNTVVLSPTGAQIELTVAPDPFSPDGDLVDDTVYFEISSIAGEQMTVTIFDRSGYVVKQLFSDEPFDLRLSWDGKDDSGRRVPVGIYIVYLEVEGVGSVKKTVVVAR